MTDWTPTEANLDCIWGELQKVENRTKRRLIVFNEEDLRVIARAVWAESPGPRMAEALRLQLDEPFLPDEQEKPYRCASCNGWIYAPQESSPPTCPGCNEKEARALLRDLSGAERSEEES